MPTSIIEHYTQNYNEDKRHAGPFDIIQKLHPCKQFRGGLILWASSS